MFVTKVKTLAAVALAFFLATDVIVVGHALAAPAPGDKKDDPKKEDRPIIKTIVTAGSGKVTIRQTGKETLAGVAVLARDVKDGVLELKNAEDVVIEVKEFPTLVHAGSGCVVGEDIKAMQVVVSTLLGSSGEVRLSGSVDAQLLTHKGSGQMDARNLKGKTAVVDVVSSGEVTVNASDSLQATIAGSGGIRYIGSPKVTRNVTGSGSVAPAR